MAENFKVRKDDSQLSMQRDEFLNEVSPFPGQRHPMNYSTLQRGRGIRTVSSYGLWLPEHQAMQQRNYPPPCYTQPGVMNCNPYIRWPRLRHPAGFQAYRFRYPVMRHQYFPPNVYIEQRFAHPMAQGFSSCDFRPSVIMSGASESDLNTLTNEMEQLNMNQASFPTHAESRSGQSQTGLTDDEKIKEGKWKKNSETSIAYFEGTTSKQSGRNGGKRRRKQEAVPAINKNSKMKEFETAKRMWPQKCKAVSVTYSKLNQNEVPKTVPQPQCEKRKKWKTLVELSGSSGVGYNKSQGRRPRDGRKSTSDTKTMENTKKQPKKPQTVNPEAIASHQEEKLPLKILNEQQVRSFADILSKPSLMSENDSSDENCSDNERKSTEFPLELDENLEGLLQEGSKKSRDYHTPKDYVQDVQVHTKNDLPTYTTQRVPEEYWCYLQQNLQGYCKIPSHLQTNRRQAENDEDSERNESGFVEWNQFYLQPSTGEVPHLITSSDRTEQIKSADKGYDEAGDFDQIEQTTEEN